MWVSVSVSVSVLVSVSVSVWVWVRGGRAHGDERLANMYKHNRVYGYLCACVCVCVCVCVYLSTCVCMCVCVIGRHCVLASRKESVPKEASDSFMHETWLCNRKTSLCSYLDANPHVMAALPPPELVGRYSG